VDVDLIGWVGVGLGGTYVCRCGILYAMLGVVFYAGLVSMTIFFLSFSLFSLFFGTYRRGVFLWSASRGLLCVRVRRHGSFVFCGRENRSVKCGQQLCCVPLFI